MNFKELKTFGKLISEPIEKRIFDTIELKEGIGFVDCIEVFLVDGRNCGYDCRMEASGLNVINGKVQLFKREVLDVSLEDFLSEIQYPFVSQGEFHIIDKLNDIDIKTKLYNATSCASIFNDVLCMKDKPYLSNSMEYEKMVRICLENTDNSTINNDMEENIMVQGEIMYDKVLNPQTYLEMMTGNYYCLRAENQLEEVENILDEQCGKGAYWSFALDDISYALKNGYKVVLVECVNIISNGNEVEQDSVFRWFEVPEEWTKEKIIERLKEI